MSSTTWRCGCRLRRGGCGGRDHVTSTTGDHACLETRCCVAKWNGDRLTCWTNHYQADQTRMYLSQMLDLPLNKVRVICPYLGGSFGRGNTGDQTFFYLHPQCSGPSHRMSRRFLVSRGGRTSTPPATPSATSCGTWSYAGAGDGTAQSRRIGDSGGYAEHTPAAIKLLRCPGQSPRRCLRSIPNRGWKATRSTRTRNHPAACVVSATSSSTWRWRSALTLSLSELDMDPIDVAIANFSHQWQDPAESESLRRCSELAQLVSVGVRGMTPGVGPETSRRQEAGLGVLLPCLLACRMAGDFSRGAVQVRICVQPGRLRDP